MDDKQNDPKEELKYAGAPWDLPGPLVSIVGVEGHPKRHRHVHLRLDIAPGREKQFTKRGVEIPFRKPR